MKTLLAAAALAVLMSAPALAAESAQTPDKSKKDPNEVICKVRQTTAGIPQRFCATRVEWARENERTRQDMMLSQKGFCGNAPGC